MSPRLAMAIQAAYEAGRSTLALFQSSFDVETKSDNSPVTEADKRAETIIRKAIGAAFPGESILGEEQGLTGHGSSRWIIDPIDGTKSFVSGVPLYSTLLSYEEDGEPILGICYFPALDEMLFAERGSGAFFNGRPARVSKKSVVKGSVVCCGSPSSLVKYHRMDGILKISESAMAVRTWSDAYGHALVATGRAEAMVDPVVKLWDISAMTLIVREAGGTATNFVGSNPLSAVDGAERHELVTTNGLVQSEILGAFAQ